MVSIPGLLLTLGTMTLMAWPGIARAADHCLATTPAGFPAPSYAFHTGLPDADAAVTAARSQLGKRLFNDARLSVTGSYRCASCHDPNLHFTDRRARSVGAIGQTLSHNAPTLHNSGLKFALNWDADGPARLRVQHNLPLTNRNPVELGFTPAMLTVLNRDPTLLAELAQAAVPDPERPGHALTALTVAALQALLAHYVASLTCATGFDDFLLEGRLDAIPRAARDGLALFTSKRLGCSDCHRGPLLGGGLRSSRPFAAVIQTRQQRRLNTPSLRGVALTAPYFFDGSAATLDAVLDQYARGESVGLPAFSLSQQERVSLLAFLRTL